MMKPLLVLILAMQFYVPAVRAQSEPEQGGHELELWTGGGRNVNGGASGIGVWNLGLRYGWILTDLHGPSILRGRFEYAVDVVPIFWVFQPSGTAYGFAVDPFALKWDFEAHHQIVPYFELSGGALFTSQQVPSGISKVNFASGGAAGLHFLRKKYTWSAEIRFQHISDAGLTTRNPGINTIQIRLGVSYFRPPK